MAGELIALIGFIIWLILAVVVFNDAEERGFNPWLWAAIVFIFGVFGLVLYIIRLLID